MNEGNNWKGDPNATLSEQDIPQPPTSAQGTPSPEGQLLPAQGAATPPIAVAEYDPNTGRYVGPDGRTYTQTDLAATAHPDQTWQSMLIPPAG